MRILIVLAILFMGFGCQKTKLKSGNGHLPRATEKGRGIFACYIDDEAYVARKQNEITYNIETGYLFLENSSEYGQIQLFVYEGIFSEGNYTFDNTGEEWVSSNYADFFGYNEGGRNELVITHLDLDLGIVSGEFNIDLIGTDSTLKTIREGRFDLEMKMIN